MALQGNDVKSCAHDDSGLDIWLALSQTKRWDFHNARSASYLAERLPHDVVAKPYWNDITCAARSTNPNVYFHDPSVPSPHITRSITHRRRSLSSTLNGVSRLPLIRLSLFLRWRQNSQGPPPARRSPCPDMSLQNRVLASRSTAVSSTNRQRRAKSEEIRTVER